MKTKYRYNFSRKVIYLGLLQIAVAVALGYLIYILFEGDYLSVWFASFVVALFLLLFLSIPQRVVVTSTAVQIGCIMEIREIKISNITSIRRINPRALRWVVPLFAGWNLFGYYGTYLNLRSFERVRLYASEWRYFVEIVDIYDDRYIISCRQGEALVRDVEQRRGLLNKSKRATK